jgi:hypothetical protein
MRVHPCVGLSLTVRPVAGPTVFGWMRHHAGPYWIQFDNSADTPIDTPLPGQDRNETAPPTRSRYGGRRDSHTAHTAGRAPSSRPLPIQLCPRRPGDAHGWS